LRLSSINHAGDDADAPPSTGQDIPAANKKPAARAAG
jgi:hypothetical protein